MASRDRTKPNIVFILLTDRRILWVDERRKKTIVQELKAQLDNWSASYVDPRCDGTHEAVTGRGQLALAGPAGKGAQAFHEQETDTEIIVSKQPTLEAR